MGRMKTDFGALLLRDDGGVEVAFRGCGSTEGVKRALKDPTTDALKQCNVAGGNVYQPIEFKGEPLRIDETVRTQRSLSPVE